MKQWLEKKRRKGFTLIELIVVLVILAILASLLVPALTGYIERAKESQAIAEARAFAMAGKAAFAEWYGWSGKTDPIKGQNDQNQKNNVRMYMQDLLKTECGMIPTLEAREKSNRYDVVSSPFKKDKWNDFYAKAGTNRGANRGVFYIENDNSHYSRISALVYLSKDGNYVVRMIFNLDCNGTDFTEADIGTYVQKVA